MRKYAVGLVLLALTFSCLESAVAAPQLGGSCRQQGAIAHYLEKTFVCAKVGKGLKYIASDGTVNSGVVPVAKVDATVLKAYNAFDHAACKTAHPNITANYLVSPNYSPEMVDKQKALFEQAMSCYNNYFSRSISVNILIATEKDYDFMVSQTMAGKPVFDAIQLRWAKFMMERDTPKSNSQRGGASGSAGWSPSLGSGWMIIIDASVNKTPDSHMASHEFVHILQSFSKSALFVNYGDGSADADYVNMPTWFWEGTAELFSTASITATANYFSPAMDQVRTQGKESPSLNKITSPAEVASTLAKIEAPSTQEANMMFYALGSVICEYILATYGYDKYWQIMKNAGTYPSFDENLKHTIGLGKNELYANAAPFVLSQWKQTKF